MFDGLLRDKSIGTCSSGVLYLYLLQQWKTFLQKCTEYFVTNKYMEQILKRNLTKKIKENEKHFFLNWS